ncbi:hypothetical protein UFOVP510_35 [uncultured Caudovirales phage]|uniref:Uncharacterized protein n=1 Tax=uncultured Caudovirales phage TaxID=2100421 RepID=A0A6J5MMH5_9CAUD|nr:hypothetical protein UFOVP510_35 [uncultured Caudovirales phage]
MGGPLSSPAPGWIPAPDPSQKKAPGMPGLWVRSGDRGSMSSHPAPLLPGSKAYTP